MTVTKGNHDTTAPYTGDGMSRNEDIIGVIPANGIRVIYVWSDTKTYSIYPIIGFAITKIVREHNKSWFTCSYPICTFGGTEHRDEYACLYPNGQIHAYEEPIFNSIEEWAQAHGLTPEKPPGA